MRYIYELNDLEYKDNLMWGSSLGISYAYIEITEKCNSKCVYCQIDQPRDIDMDAAIYKSIIDQLSELKAFEIRIGGGEPLLCKQIVPYVAYAHSKGLAVWICTNGRLLNKKMAFELKKAAATGVKVSLDSCIPNKHNQLRGGTGSWEKAVAAIRNAQLAGLEVMINYTIGVQNIDEYEQMIHFGNLLGCTVATHFIMPKGRGEEYHRKYDMKTSFSQAQNVIIKELKGDLYCTAGSDMIAFSVTGGVRACLFSDDIANVQNQKLKEILKSKEMKRYLSKVPDSPVCKECSFDKIINSDTGCPLISVCRGGCWYFYEKGIVN